MFINKLKFTLMVALLISLLLLLYSCNPTLTDTVNSSEGGGVNEWLILQSEVMDGGPGKDGIPALTDPLLLPVDQIDFMASEDLLIGIRVGDQIIGFPHRILDQHEIINILNAKTPFIISYCPLTGSGMAWKAPIDANDKSYGVSGLLYNSNLILYDRQTDSNWSQMLMKCVNGTLIKQDAEMLHVIETQWGTWKEMYPDSLIVSKKICSSNTRESTIQEQKYPAPLKQWTAGALLSY